VSSVVSSFLVIGGNEDWENGDNGHFGVDGLHTFDVHLPSGQAQIE
jgi:hypothetical protein